MKRHISQQVLKEMELLILKFVKRLYAKNEKSKGAYQGEIFVSQNIFGGNTDCYKIEKLKKVVLIPEPAQKCETKAIFKEKQKGYSKTVDSLKMIGCFVSVKEET